MLGDRLIAGLYDLLEHLITARYTPRVGKPALLGDLNRRLDVLRYQTRLLLDFSLIDSRHCEYAASQLHRIGSEVGAWLRAYPPPTASGGSHPPVARGLGAT